VHLNIIDHNFDGNEVGGYSDHHVESMLNDTVRYVDDSPMTGRNVQA